MAVTIVPKGAGELGALLKDFHKKYGETIGGQGVKLHRVKRVPTGIFPLDLAMGGGFPRSRLSIVYGPEGCLSADTHIQYEIRTQDGKRQNHKGGSLERLYRRFHGISLKGKGSYQRHVSVNSVYYLSSINSEGRVFQQEILDVVDSGKKECFELVTEGGLRIEATADHQFFDGVHYKPLKDLLVGDTVMVHTNTPFKKTDGIKRHKPTRNYVFVKHHPIAGVKYVDKYRYKRLLKSRALIEAHVNGLTFEDYVARLNSGNLEGLDFLPREYHVHHLNGDCKDDRLENLQILSSDDHNREHAIESHNNLRYAAQPARIVSIASVGIRQTYDIRMPPPHHNFIANKFVVHNSGKSNLALLACKHVQNHCAACDHHRDFCVCPEGPTILKAVYIDTEHTYDSMWAHQLGVDNEEIVLLQPSYAEQAADIVEAVLSAADVGIVVLDSVANLTTTAMIDNSAEKAEMGGAALVTTKLVKKATAALSTESKREHHPLLLCINQTRTRLGVMYGDPEGQPGGKMLQFASSMTVRIYGKELFDKEISSALPSFKETSVVVKKWKAPIVCKSTSYNFCVLAHNDHSVGWVDDWNTVSNYLKTYELLGKNDKGKYACVNMDGELEEFNTLTAIRTKYETDLSFNRFLKKIVIDNELKFNGINEGGQ